MIKSTLIKKLILKNLSISSQFLICLLLCGIPTWIIAKFSIYQILLTENSILYLHATSAQVIAALIALSLVAYTHLNSELNQKANTDSSWEDAIFLTKSNAFKDLSLTLLVGVLSITASLLVLSSFKYKNFQDVFMSFSFLSLLIFTYTLMRFVHRSFSPTAIQNNNNQILQESKSELEDLKVANPANNLNQKEFPDVPQEDSLEASLGKFFIAFSAFETKLRNAYSKYNGFVPKNRNGSLRNVVNELVTNFGVIPYNLHKETLSLIKIRNSLAHASHETSITSQEIDKYISIINFLEKEIGLDDINYSPSTTYNIVPSVPFQEIEK